MTERETSFSNYGKRKSQHEKAQGNPGADRCSCTSFHFTILGQMTFFLGLKFALAMKTTDPDEEARLTPGLERGSIAQLSAPLHATFIGTKYHIT